MLSIPICNWPYLDLGICILVVLTMAIVSCPGKTQRKELVLLPCSIRIEGSPETPGFCGLGSLPLFGVECELLRIK